MSMPLIRSRGEPGPRRAPHVSSLLLRNVPMFALLTEAQREALVGVAQRRVYPRGTTIIEAGEISRSLHIVVSGHVQVVVRGGPGREVILAILQAGEHFGEMSLLDDQPRSAHVVARDTCELMTLAKQDFERCMSENFDLTMAVARGLVRRLRDADKMISSLALLDVHGRVAQVLLENAERLEGKWIVPAGLRRGDIAKMVGASREMVSRALKNLQQGGHLDIRGTRIVLRERIFGAG